MKRNDMIAYVQYFAAFLLQSSIADKIKGIVIFGSVARGDFTKESDIDVFIDTPVDSDEIEKELLLFEESEMNRLWRLKGVGNKISVKCGNLDKHPLKRSILVDGITIFGKYEGMPKKMEHYFLFRLNFEGMKRNKKIVMWRKLYGYKQKINGKTYTAAGLINELNGKKLVGGIVVIPAREKNIFMQHLRSNKIDFTLFEIWSDEL